MCPECSSRGGGASVPLRAPPLWPLPQIATARKLTVHLRPPASCDLEISLRGVKLSLSGGPEVGVWLAPEAQGSQGGCLREAAGWPRAAPPDPVPALVPALQPLLPDEEHLLLRLPPPQQLVRAASPQRPLRLPAPRSLHPPPREARLQPLWVQEAWTKQTPGWPGGQTHRHTDKRVLGASVGAGGRLHRAPASRLGGRALPGLGGDRPLWMP